MQNFSKVIIFARFKINQEYISKTLCVKKDEPLNCCKGKCYLKKELKKDEDREKDPASNSNKEKQETFVYFCKELKYFNFYQSSVNPLHLTPYLESKLPEAIHAIFHPPKYTT